MHLTSQDYNKLIQYLDHHITGKKTPGIQYILADASGILFEYNEGYEDIITQTPVDVNTQFKMYSSTKLLTMLAIMKLAEENKLSLDAPISKYLPFEFPSSITIRRVLSHTAGFTKYPFIKEVHLESEHQSFNYSDFIKTQIPQHQKLKYKPGQKNKYSNYGYLVLSGMIEQVSGMNYIDYIQSQIINKANLPENDSIGFQFTNQTATGHQRRNTLMHWAYSLMVDTKKYYGKKTNTWQAYKDLYIDGMGFGGGMANARSLTHFFITVLNGQIIDKSNLAKTFELQTFGGNKTAKQTLGWWHGKVGEYQSYYHPGGGGGYSCEVRIYPELGIVRVMMMNKTQTFGDLKLFAKIDNLWLR